MTIQLYSYWRSQAAFRVRIALKLKGLPAQTIEVDLAKNEQHAATFRALNPQMAVPTLIDGDAPPLTQSMAILEYLEECYPQPPLLPANPHDRAYVRGLALALAADAHPFVTPRVGRFLEKELRIDAPARLEWMTHWVEVGFATIEAQLAHGGKMGLCCWGDAPTLADLCLIPYVATATMLPTFDFTPYPRAMAIFEYCMTMEAFKPAPPVS